MSGKITKRSLPPLIYPRTAGYAIGLCMHLINAVHMSNTFKGDVLQDPDVKRFHDDQFKFLTVWNVYMQMIYLSLGLSCEVLSLANVGKDSPLLKTLKRIRDPLFSSVVIPNTFTVATMFWAAVSYDRSFILPPTVDRTLGWTANHVIHTAIVPVAVWELIFRPRRAPESHIFNLAIMYSFDLTYLIVLVTSYLRVGAWIYPILNVLDGTIYLYLFLGSAVVLLPIFYSLQWVVTGLIWDKYEPKKIE